MFFLVFIVALWATLAAVVAPGGMTAEGVVVWLAGLVGPVIVGQLRRFAIKVDGNRALVLAIVISLLLAVGVEIYFGGLHVPTDIPDLASMAGLVFTVATAAYKILYGSLAPATKAKLVG